MSTTRLVEQKMPMPMPERLHSHFNEYVQEYGANAAEAKEFHQTRAWAVVDSSDRTAGYVWLEEKSGEHPGLYLSIAIFSEFQRNGFSKFARREAERILQGEGCDAVFAQINNCRADSGLPTRMSLLRDGFRLLERPWSKKKYEGLSDEDYSARIPLPLKYRKPLR